MEFSENDLETIRAFNADPNNPRTTYALGALFWSSLCTKIGTLIREKGNVQEFIQNERNYLDFGLVDAVREDHKALSEKLVGDFGAYRHLKVRTFSNWLEKTIEEIMECNQADLIQRDIKNAQMQIMRLQKDTETVQEARKDLLLAQLADPGTTVPCGSLLAQVGRLTQLDTMLFESLKTKKSISKGAFFSVEQRRAFVERESQLQKEQARYEGLASRVQAKQERATLNNLTAQIAEIYNKVIDFEDNIVKMQQQIADIEQRRDAMSPVEIENRAIRAIEYNRDLVKLCARRLRVESCSILRPKDHFFTVKELSECLDRILEFDPRIFINDRVNFIGKPMMLLIPGNGNAIYDWKNNLFIIPLVPPGGDFVGSLAAAMIEYRFDVDDDKKLLTSYNKLPEYRSVKSIYQLKGQLTKEYIAWMTQEYKGYRVLSKDVKQWFEHEIAPSRKEIFCPPEYQQFSMNAKQFKELLDSVDTRLGTELSQGAEDDLWAGSILNYQQGRFEKAFECVKALLEKNNDHLFAHYNLGHIGMRISRKQDAIQGFSEFGKRNPQSWWAGVARDHLRRLMAG